MKTLHPTDHVIYDKPHDHVIRFSSDDSIVIYGSKEEAEIDRQGTEEVIPCTELPAKYQEELIAQINRD
jgi:hypothetical protein